ncbi:MAG: hypothetical protein M1828_000150 [Chrysothrix sp. TS-e1954]|nr:MAG: hypothetical protein M1828_000150 [Chrysothrix sp. TS-e1954]
MAWKGGDADDADDVVASASGPDLYKVLEVSPGATQQQVRDGYKKAALKHHPDRVPSDSPERPARTKRFQQINDAYFTLSDPSRRREYDSARSSGGTFPGAFADDPDEEYPSTSNNANGNTGRGFPWSFFSSSSSNTGTTPEEASSQQFGSVFEEMLREEGMAEGADAAPNSKFWSFVGALSGGAMGFIVANFPGAVAGGVAGNRLGAVRDARGKSVYSVFRELPQGDKARLLSDLAAKVFAHAVSA